MDSIRRNDYQRAVKETVGEFGPIKKAQFDLTIALMTDDEGGIERARIRLSQLADFYGSTDEQHDAAIDQAYENAVIFTAEY